MPTLTADDADAMARECPSVLAASPIVGTTGQVIYGNTNWSPQEMAGVGTDYLTVRNWQLRHGGFFTERDVTSAAKVCVIGQTIVAKLFQTTNPLGKTIRIRNIPFQVIGVLETKGANMVGEDQDNIVLMPYTTVRKRLQGSNFDNVDVILASARSVDRMAEAENEIRQLLCERHRIAPGKIPDFEVQNTTEIANVLGIITGTMTLLLASIAGISLLVGGVGIMNIMLVSVTERTREIGIRMAVGARGRDILRQFLVESMLLSSIGGVVGWCSGPAPRPASPCHQFADQRHALAGGHLLQGRDHRHALRRSGGHLLRLLPGPPRQPARPDRGPAVRVRRREARNKGKIQSWEFPCRSGAAPGQDAWRCGAACETRTSRSTAAAGRQIPSRLLSAPVRPLEKTSETCEKKRNFRNSSFVILADLPVGQANTQHGERPMLFLGEPPLASGYIADRWRISSLGRWRRCRRVERPDRQRQFRETPRG